MGTATARAEVTAQALEVGSCASVHGMKAAWSPLRGGVFWGFFGAMVLAVLGAAFSLIGGVESDAQRLGLWIVIAVGGLALLTMLLVPHRIERADRREE